MLMINPEFMPENQTPPSDSEEALEKEQHGSGLPADRVAHCLPSKPISGGRIRDRGKEGPTWQSALEGVADP